MQEQIQNTHRVELGGESRLVNVETYQSVCDEMVARHGGQPKVTPLFQMQGLTPVLAAPLVPVVKPGEVDKIGADRSNEARFESKLNGFSPKPPIYAVGSRVVEMGVENARSSRLEYDALPRVSESCGALIKTVADEHRMDVVVERFNAVRMMPDGRLLRSPGSSKEPVRLTEHAFGGFLSRSGIGGHSYLAKCPAELRAINVNFWQEEAGRAELADEIEAKRTGDKKWEPKDGKFRTRINHGNREIFAVVSSSYGAFDVDKIATALSMAAPADARGSVVYDGTRAKFEVLFHTNIAPEQFVAGEFFKAGVLVRTDDTGSGAIRISACVWQNLCLNLIILDECVQEIAAIRHVGSVEVLADKFREGFAKALGSIEQFLDKWNYAVQDDLSSDVCDEQGVAVPISVLLPGLFNGIVERELVPVRGARKDIVPALVRMYEADDSAATNQGFISRAGIVNAFTRYAHEVNRDAFEQDAIERAAGALLKLDKRTTEIPFEPIDF